MFNHTKCRPYANLERNLCLKSAKKAPSAKIAVHSEDLEDLQNFAQSGEAGYLALELGIFFFAEQGG